MELEEIKTLQNLLEKLSNINFWDETNILKYLEDDTIKLDMDIATTCELLQMFLNEKYSTCTVTAWQIKK